jgi:hypothetical protein
MYTLSSFTSKLMQKIRLKILRGSLQISKTRLENAQQKPREKPRYTIMHKRRGYEMRAKKNQGSPSSETTMT